MSFQANAPEGEGVAALVEGLVQREGLGGIEWRIPFCATRHVHAKINRPDLPSNS